MLCLDLDGFKAVNDMRGHEVGDKLLSAVAARVRESVRGSDTVARVGGDEFAIVQLLEGQPASATSLAERLSPFSRSVTVSPESTDSFGKSSPGSPT